MHLVVSNCVPVLGVWIASHILTLCAVRCRMGGTPETDPNRPQKEKENNNRQEQELGQQQPAIAAAHAHAAWLAVFAACLVVFGRSSKW